MADRKFTDLELERLLANDLPAARASEIAATATDADRLRLDALRAEHHAFLSRVDVAAELRGIAARGARTPTPTRAPWWRWIVTGGALAAATAAIVLVVVRDRGSDDDDLRIKGDGVSLVIHAERRRLATGDTVRPGERIRFEVVATKPGYVAIVGIDGSSGSTVYYPYLASAPEPIDPAQGLLPGAIELDATPGDERFVALYAEQPFSIDLMIPLIRSGGVLPAEISSSEVVLRKW